jgi:hypothetical protein
VLEQGFVVAFLLQAQQLFFQFMLVLHMALDFLHDSRVILVNVSILVLILAELDRPMT